MRCLQQLLEFILDLLKGADFEGLYRTGGSDSEPTYNSIGWIFCYILVIIFLFIL